MQILQIFLGIVPFFLVVATGYGTARSGFFSSEAIAWITKFVFYIALPAMLFQFASGFTLTELYDSQFFYAYLCATFALYIATKITSLLRGVGWAEAAIEAQTATIGNVGFLGIPILVLLLGDYAVGPIIFYLALDLIIFGTLIVVSVKVSQEGKLTLNSLKKVLVGIATNPMVASIILGLFWGQFQLPLTQPGWQFVDLLSGAATPCALFVIGASLAAKSAERVFVAVWLSSIKLILHPLLIAICAFWVFDVDPLVGGVMVAAAAMPTAGNIYILAQHFGVAPARVSSTILVSTAASVITLSIAIALIQGVS